MAVFEYKALDAKGRQRKGIKEADTARQARQMLRDEGLMPTQVNETAATASKADNPHSNETNISRFTLRKRTRVSVNDLSLLTRQLATLVQSGLPLEEALHAVAQQCEKAQLTSMIMAIRGKVLEGFNLADSLRLYPSVFDNLYCATVAAGEKSGHLDTVLNRLADYVEQRQQTKSKIIQALLYPMVLMVIAFGVIAVLLTSVVPKVVDQFQHMGQTLPFATRALIACSDFLLAYGLHSLLVVALLILLFKAFVKKPANKHRYHKVQLRFPVVGKVMLGLNTARYARTLSILTASAVPLLEAMRIAGDVLLNIEMKTKLEAATARVREGTSLRVALTATSLFPPIMLHMIASGEKSGELEQMLGRAADNQDREFDNMMTVALGLLGPLVLVSMAVVVLFIVVAILQPILELNNLVGI